jgi:hypothetical protein
MPERRTLSSKVVVAVVAGFAAQAAATPYHRIVIRDAASGAPIPLAEVETVHRVVATSDNAGNIAFLEPDLMGTDVHLRVRSHGYDEPPADGFGIRGVRFTPKADGVTEIKLQRRHLATRVGRLTGAGRWRETQLLGLPCPPAARAPLGAVLGQDSVQTVSWAGRLWWFWGDTARASYPLGNFRMAGATTPPAAAWLDQVETEGIPFQYFTAADGFARPMVDLPEKEGVVWLDGICALPQADGAEHLVAHYSRRRDLGTELEHGLVQCAPGAAIFKPLATAAPLGKSWRHPVGHAVLHCEGATTWMLFGDPFPSRRIPAQFSAVTDPSAWEAWDGTRWQKEHPPAPQTALREAKTDRPITLHRGTVQWNDFRQKWIMIANEIGGISSHLGEVYFAEAPAPTGPWGRATRIVTHDKMDFYNPIHHPFMDQENGRVIHFEGTYTMTFAGAVRPTPRYEYNQILYRLDLSVIPQ